MLFALFFLCSAQLTLDAIQKKRAMDEKRYIQYVETALGGTEAMSGY